MKSLMPSRVLVLNHIQSLQVTKHHTRSCLYCLSKDLSTSSTSIVRISVCPGELYTIMVYVLHAGETVTAGTLYPVLRKRYESSRK